MLRLEICEIAATIWNGCLNRHRDPCSHFISTFFAWPFSNSRWHTKWSLSPLVSINHADLARSIYGAFPHDISWVSVKCDTIVLQELFYKHRPIPVEHVFMPIFTARFQPFDVFIDGQSSNRFNPLRTLAFLLEIGAYICRDMMTALNFF